MFKDLGSVLMEEHEWMIKNPSELQKYAGRWIAVLKNKVIAHGRTFSDAYSKSKKLAPDAIPLITYVLKKGEELLIV